MSRGKITEQELDDGLRIKVSNLGDDTNNELTNLTNRINDVADALETLTFHKENKDGNGVFTKVTFRRKKDNSLFAISILSEGVAPQYLKRTITRYLPDGQSIKSVVQLDLQYDTDGQLVKEV